MKKQQKIQEAYESHGFNWIQAKEYVDENGWSKHRIGNSKALTNKRCGVSWRPEELYGLDENNGWILIKNEADLPAEKELFKFIPLGLFHKEFTGWIDKKLGEVFFIDFDYYEIEFDGSIYSSKTNGWLISQITHYQPIIKSKPPIY